MSLWSGKCPRVLIALRIWRCRPSIVLVTGMKGGGCGPVPSDGLGAGGVRGGGYGATVRDGGIAKQTRLGRPVLLDGLRARVSRWPPLRLARMRRERESVGVVCPPVSLHVQRCRR